MVSTRSTNALPAVVVHKLVPHQTTFALSTTARPFVGGMPVGVCLQHVGHSPPTAVVRTLDRLVQFGAEWRLRRPRLSTCLEGEQAVT